MESLLGSKKYKEEITDEQYLGESVLKIFSQFTGEHPWRSVI